MRKKAARPLVNAQPARLLSHLVQLFLRVSRRTGWYADTFMTDRRDIVRNISILGSIRYNDHIDSGNDVHYIDPGCPGRGQPGCWAVPMHLPPTGSHRFR